ncbi:MAG: aspartate-semialdehyde dehydrogenase [Candidatus Endobugula sp.]
MDTIDLAIIGATGAVGEVVVELLGKSTFPVKTLYLLSSERTAGTSLQFRSKPLMVNLLENFDFSQVQMAIFVATDAVSLEYVPKAQAAGCMVIDNSQAFTASGAPLIIPSVNGDLFKQLEKPSLVINPDSSVVSLWTVLKPIYDAVGIQRVNVTAYDSVSRHGKKAINELATQTASLLNGQGAEPKFYKQQIAFNVLPNVGEVDENGHSTAEVCMLEQTKAIINDPLLQINVTCIQVPVFYADSMAVTIETGDPIDAEEVRKLLENNNEIKVLDDNEAQEFATPVTTAAGNDDIFVSRIRNDMSHSRGVNLWLVADNVRKGAALNTILIAEELKKSYL